jgi:hypothetical protein|nr:MAG TPA: hypothetical protein [Caudoviricetes sp.]
MNGYKISADAYREFKKRDPKIDVDSNIKVLDFLATCTQEDICNLFNSSAFNNICMGYVKIALNDFKELGEDMKDRITNHVRYKFDTVTAEQAENYNNEC